MNCDHIARAYRYLEYAAFGRVLQTCRTTFLAHAAHCRSALVIGDGDGRFLQQLCAGKHILQVLSIDESSSMLALQQSRIQSPASKHVLLNQHDARLGIPGTGYDLIATHFFFDCLQQAETDRLVEQIAAIADPNAVWLVSEFHVPEDFWYGFRASFLIAAMYAFFRLTTGLRLRKIPDYSTALSRNGFTLTACKTFSAGMIRAEFWKRSTTPILAA